MRAAHTWRDAMPGQPCQLPPCRCVAVWVLTVARGVSEELLCAECAPIIASLYGLSDPTTSSAEALTSAQTSEAGAAVTASASEPKEVGPQ
jgi:hypothetical protein